jgi:putative endonuclease
MGRSAAWADQGAQAGGPRPTAKDGRSGRRLRGLSAWHAGLAAEEAVARRYGADGARIEARRWRCREGEIDLVVRLPDCLVFVEVKCGRHAAEAISERQWRRLEAAALRYTVEQETGDTCLRFDAALVGPDGAVSIVENARGF